MIGWYSNFRTIVVCRNLVGAGMYVSCPLVLRLLAHGCRWLQRLHFCERTSLRVPPSIINISARPFKEARKQRTVLRRYSSPLSHAHHPSSSPSHRTIIILHPLLVSAIHSCKSSRRRPAVWKRLCGRRCSVVVVTP